MADDLEEAPAPGAAPTTVDGSEATPSPRQTGLSVVLGGSLQGGAQDCLSWTGEWRYSQLSEPPGRGFQYKRIDGNAVAPLPAWHLALIQKMSDPAAVDGARDLGDWPGWWHGSFTLRRNGREGQVQERFVLVPLGVDGSRARVGGGGANTFGCFQLAGECDVSAGTLVCERRYVQLPRKRRKEAAVPAAANGAPVRCSQRQRQRETLPEAAAYNTRKRPTRRLPGEDGGDSGSDGEAEPERRASYHLQPRASSDEVSGEDDEPAATGPDRRRRRLDAGGGAKTAGGGAAPDLDNGWRAASFEEESHEVYEGEFQDGLREGSGVCVYVNNGHHMYEGEWQRGREHGKGVLMTANREVLFDGEFVEGKIHGRGTYYFLQPKHVYSGDWRENARSGHGVYLLADGSRYEGEWRDNQRSGKGRFECADGSVYDGDWLKGQRHGRGRLKLASGLTYEGQWSANEFDGRGVCTYADGQRYEGLWKAGKKDGRGTLLFPNGASYEGRFRDDRIDGQGTFRLPPNPVVAAAEGDWLVPVEFPSDIGRVHAKAGFDRAGK